MADPRIDEFYQKLLDEVKHSPDFQKLKQALYDHFFESGDRNALSRILQKKN